jgi:hypothetical protein
VVASERDSLQLFLQARRRCAEYEADQAEQEKAARELRNALADYLSSRPAETPRLTEPRPQNSWESLETRVMGLEVTQVDPETPRSSLRKSPSIWRSGYTPRRLTASSRTSGRSPVLSKDPLGRISEMVAQVARERYNKCVTQPYQILSFLRDLSVFGGSRHTLADNGAYNIRGRVRLVSRELSMICTRTALPPRAILS